MKNILKRFGQMLMIISLSGFLTFTGMAKAEGEKINPPSERSMDTNDLTELIILNNLFDNRGNDDLTDLIVLNRLFDGGNSDLADLIAIDRFTGDGDRTRDLTDLIVLNRIFGGSNSNLSDLIVLDNVFR